MTIDLSIVIPAYNEEESIDELIGKIFSVTDQNGFNVEIIFINDGSTDLTQEKIEAFYEKDKRVKLINFRRNFGKSAALSIGFKRATGKIIITMDADLQDDPEEITNLVKKIDEGYDLVSGWKKKRNDPLEKRIPSKVFNAITSKLGGIKMHDFNCGLKAYRSEVTKEIKIYGEMHRFLPVLAYWQGFRIGEIAVKHHARKFGYSKFGARRYFSGFFDLMTVLFITKYKRKPMHIFGFMGLLFAGSGFAALAYLITIWFMGEGIGDRPLLLISGISIIIGIQFIGIGLLGELITNTSERKREYSIRSMIGFKN